MKESLMRRRDKGRTKTSNNYFLFNGRDSDGQTKTEPNSVALVRRQTIPTERPPLVGKVSANLCG
jgi:hypothetical protein